MERAYLFQAVARNGNLIDAVDRGLHPHAMLGQYIDQALGRTKSWQSLRHVKKFQHKSPFYSLLDPSVS